MSWKNIAIVAVLTLILGNWFMSDPSNNGATVGDAVGKVLGGIGIGLSEIWK
jgi:hypothetical protein